jgi:hypothetical protein
LHTITLWHPQAKSPHTPWLVLLPAFLALCALAFSRGAGEGADGGDDEHAEKPRIPAVGLNELSNPSRKGSLA